jgi:hypothetical protein
VPGRDGGVDPLVEGGQQHCQLAAERDAAHRQPPRSHVGAANQVVHPADQVGDPHPLQRSAEGERVQECVLAARASGLGELA